MKNRLWTRNFTLLIAASGLGAVGGIAGGFAMSFLVFDETGSTLASALVRVVIQHFSKNTVISMVLGHPNSEITCIPPS